MIRERGEIRDSSSKEEGRAEDLSETLREKGKEPSENPEDILRGILEEIEEPEPPEPEDIERIKVEAYEEKKDRDRRNMARIEDEAYAEASERYIRERKIQEEERHFESVSRCAFAEGSTTYAGLRAGEEQMRLLSVGSERDRREARIEYSEYLKQFEKDLRGGSFRASELPKSILMSREGIDLDFGVCTNKVDGRLNRDSYFRTVREVHESLDRRLEGLGKAELEEKTIPIIEKTLRAATQRHLEGFGTAALDFGKDPDTAARAFIEGGLMDDPEIVKKLADRMKELFKSEDISVRANVLAAKKRVEAWLQAKKEGGGAETDAGEE